MAQDALQRARAGDERAFRELTEPHRRELLVHCYRLLGSLTDAEDLLQETLLAAWRGLAGFQERASVRSWLYRIATNRCLNARRDAARRVPTEPTPPFTPPEPTCRGDVPWLQPYPDALLDGLPDTTPGPEARYELAESVELAFVAAVQRLPPRQAAALVLRDVLGFDTGEVADLLDATRTAVKGALQRARARLEELRSSAAGGLPVRGAAAEEREVGRRFAAAFTAADVEGIVGLLTDDAWLAMPPAPHEYQGVEAITAFLKTSFAFRAGRRALLVPTAANTQPAFGSYIADGTGVRAAPAGLFVLTPAGDRIAAITRFHIDELYPRFGLPVSLDLR